MAEPTLEQWKERALVAEALLAGLRQEAEGLRADLTDAKAKLDAKPENKEDTAKREGWREQYRTQHGCWPEDYPKVTTPWRSRGKGVESTARIPFNSGPSRVDNVRIEPQGRDGSFLFSGSYDGRPWAFKISQPKVAQLMMQRDRKEAIGDLAIEIACGVRDLLRLTDVLSILDLAETLFNAIEQSPLGK